MNRIYVISAMMCLTFLAKNYMDIQAKEKKGRMEASVVADKRNKLVSHYEFESESSWHIIMINRGSNKYAVEEAFNHLNEMKEDMRKDGFDGAEISDIQLAGYRAARESYNETYRTKFPAA